MLFATAINLRMGVALFGHFEAVCAYMPDKTARAVVIGGLLAVPFLEGGTVQGFASGGSRMIALCEGCSLSVNSSKFLDLLRVRPRQPVHLKLLQ